MTSIKPIIETPPATVPTTGQATSKEEEKLKDQFNAKGVVINGNLMIDTQHESRIWKALSRLATLIVIVWGGQGIYDRNFNLSQGNENLKAIIKILDKDGDGKLSKEEIEETKKLIGELEKWNKVRDFFGNFTGKK